MGTPVQYSSGAEYFVPSPDVVTSIVLPTILFCICMVAAMLIGIRKCRQWEVDKLGEMRRTRRVVQRVTQRLREKNFRTIQRARHLRKRAQAEQRSRAPPLYGSSSAEMPMHTAGTSPPPSYEDALLDHYFCECIPAME